MNKETLNSITKILLDNCKKQMDVLNNISTILEMGDMAEKLNSMLSSDIDIKLEINNKDTLLNENLANEDIEDDSLVRSFEETQNSIAINSDNIDKVNNVNRTDISKINKDEHLLETVGLMSEYDRLMEKRKQLHKTNGTYDATKDCSETDGEMSPAADGEMPLPICEEIAVNMDKMNISKPLQKGIDVDNLPIANALHRLDWKERENLEKNIFKKAIHNVETLLQIKRDDPTFKKHVMEESDRLLEVWKKSY